MIAQVAVELGAIRSGPDEFVAIERGCEQIAGHTSRRRNSLIGHGNGLVVGCALCRNPRGKFLEGVFLEKGDHGGFWELD